MLSVGSLRVVLRYVLAIAIPLALIPVAAIGTKEARCAYVILLMAFYWIVEPVPIPVTSLFPVIFFPLFSILSTAEACAPYMSSTTMVFLAGLIMATAIEHCNLHKRIALKVLLVVGTSTRRLLVGFMASSAFLSMWISNTATTAMMVPIVEAVIVEIRKESDTRTNGMELKEDISSLELPKDAADDGEAGPLPATTSQNISTLRKGLLLSVAYAANIGGTGTLIGTGPNLVLQGVLSKKFPKSNDITFASWMVYAVPGLIICLILAWILLYLMFFHRSSQDAQSSKNIRTILQSNYNELGPINFHQGAVIFLFVLMIILLFMQEPRFIPGWASAISSVAVKDATPAVAVVIFLFLIPSDPFHLSTSPALIQWQVVQNKVPWGIILLLGGGFSMASGFQKSGLSDWVKNQLTGLQVLSSQAVLIILSLITAGLTELTSNTTTASAFLPVVGDLALVLSMNPLFLMLPVAIACSFAFMLPIATPPNAIVYEAAKMRTRDMALPGFLMNFICCAVSVASVNTVGAALFGIWNVPDWATSGQASISADNVTLPAFANMTGS